MAPGDFSQEIERTALNDSHVMTLADGRELGWVEYGASEGWPIFGFHGTPGSRLQLGLNVDAVQRADVRLIAPDRPGYGLSTFQPSRRLVEWPDDVRQLADHLGIDRFSVVGISGGGPHAAACASLLPLRVVAAGLVSGAGPLSDQRITADMSRRERFLAATFAKNPLILKLLFNAEIALVRRWPTKALDLMVKQLPPSDAQLLRRPDLRELFERDVRNASRTTGRAQAQDLELFASDWGFDLSQITIPVHLWQGDADRNVPPLQARVMHDAIPNSVLQMFPGEGHFLIVDRFEEILTALKA